MKPIEPVFVDYKKDMSQFEARKGIDVLYKKNESNDIFTLTYVFDTGTENDPALNLAFDYLGYLGSESLTAEQIASKMYGIACRSRCRPAPPRAASRLRDWERIWPKPWKSSRTAEQAKPDEAILANLKADMIKSRADAKLNQSRCFGALRLPCSTVPDFIQPHDAHQPGARSDDLGNVVGEDRRTDGQTARSALLRPASEKEVTGAGHAPQNVARTFSRSDKKFTATAAHGRKRCCWPSTTPSSSTTCSMQTAAKVRRRGRPRNHALQRVFRRRHEHRSSSRRCARHAAWPTPRRPASCSRTYAKAKYGYMAFIATQNDKMQMAIEAFDEIINNMPESETAFKIAKEGLISRLRTDRTVKEQVLWSFIGLRNLGLEEDRDKQIFEKVQAMTLADVKRRAGEVGQEPQIRLRHPGRHPGSRPQLPQDARSDPDRLEEKEIFGIKPAKMLFKSPFLSERAFRQSDKERRSAPPSGIRDKS